jgi:hypothetical protein
MELPLYAAETDHSPSSNAEIKNDCSYISNPMHLVGDSRAMISQIACAWKTVSGFRQFYRSKKDRYGLTNSKISCFNQSGYSWFSFYDHDILTTFYTVVGH